MQRSLSFAFLLLLALLAAGIWWFTRGTTAAPTRPPASAQPTADAAVAAEQAAQLTAERESVDGDARSAAEATGPDERPNRSFVRVLARWPNGEPATGVQITLRAATREQGHQVFAQQPADAAGITVFRSVPIGKWSVRSDRGDRKTIEVEGGEQDFVFELAGGVTLTGLVVAADDRPVAGASVWLQTRDPLWTGGRVLTTTGPDGRFALAQVPQHVSLGAFAAGHSPSDLLDLDVVDTSTEPVEVKLQLFAKSGQLVGLVVDALDQPIAHALVGLGKENGRLDVRGERVVERWSIRTTRSDEHGRFSLAGLTPGDAPVTVRAPGFGFWRSTGEIVDGQTTEIIVRMQQSGTVRGVVRDADGEPLPGAVVCCYDRQPGTHFVAGGQIDFDETFGFLATAAAADGSFALEDVTAGTAWLFAQPGGHLRWGESVPYATAELEIPAGGTVEWNPAISDGRVIEGVVYFRDGHAMGDVFITLIDERTQKQHVQTNNQEGVFRFVNLDASTYTARVQYWDAPKGTPALERAGLIPDQGRVELRAPFDKPVKLAPGSVLGRIDDIGGRIQNVKAVRVALMSDQGWFHDNGKLVDGAFHFDKVKPCRFRLALMADETALAHSDWFDLQPGAVLDAGVLRTEPAGAVRVTVTRTAGAEDCAPKLYLKQRGAPRSTQADLGRVGELLVPNLTPGDYEVNVYSAGMVAIESEVTVVAGNTAELPLQLVAGRLCRFEIWLPADASPQRYHWRIADKDGRVFRERRGDIGTLPTRPYPVVVSLPYGDWSITFEADERLAAKVDFAVQAGQQDLTTRLDAAAR